MAIIKKKIPTHETAWEDHKIEEKHFVFYSHAYYVQRLQHNNLNSHQKSKNSGKPSINNEGGKPLRTFPLLNIKELKEKTNPVLLGQFGSHSTCIHETICRE